MERKTNFSGWDGIEMIEENILNHSSRFGLEEDGGFEYGK